MNKQIVSELLAETAHSLSSSQSPRLDARWLIGLALGYDSPVMGHEQHQLTPQQYQLLQKFITERQSGKPVSRIRGKRSFYKADFYLNEATLDPRPDSEILVEAAIAAAQNQRQKECQILDLGTGTGCLLLSILGELETAYGLGVDCQASAVAQARANAAYLGLADRAQFQVGDWCKGLRQKCDILISNPPYIAVDDPQCADDVAAFDPELALFAGRDGIDAYRVLFPQMAGLMHHDSVCLVEIGAGQEDQVIEIAASAHLKSEASFQDLAQRVRVLSFVKNR